MRNFLWLFPFFFAFLTSCDSTKYTMDYDKEYDFSKIKKYKFLPLNPESSQGINELDRERLYDAVRVELDDRGMTEVGENPDAFVNMLILLKNQTGYSGYTDYYSPYGFGYGYGYGTGHTTYSSYTYTTGTLIIDIFDAKEKRLVWQGSAAGEVKENQKSYQKEADARTVMRNVFKLYPVRRVK